MGEEFDRRKGALTEDDEAPEVEGHRRHSPRDEEPPGDEFDRRKGALSEEEGPEVEGHRRHSPRDENPKSSDDPGRWHGR